MGIKILKQISQAMFRGSSYSMETERDLSLSNLTEQNIKIAVVGIADVGKSSIINCIQKEKFNEDIEPTSGFQLTFKKIKVNHNLLVNLTVWDASGFRTLHYIQQGKLKPFDGIIYVYDLSQPNSIIQLETFLGQLTRQGAEHISMLVGNKADLVVVKDKKTQEYKIPSTVEAFSLGQKFSERHSMIHQNVSAKYNTHITDCFVLMITEILNKKRHLRVSRFEEEELSIQDDEKSPKCNWDCHWEKCHLI